MASIVHTRWMPCRSRFWQCPASTPTATLLSHNFDHQGKECVLLKSSYTLFFPVPQSPQEWLPSLRSSVKRIIVHVGTNDTQLLHSEVTKAVFLYVLKHLRLRSNPTIVRGAGQFSRLYNLHSWLLSACRAQNVAFNGNFNIFWNNVSFLTRMVLIQTKWALGRWLLKWLFMSLSYPPESPSSSSRVPNQSTDLHIAAPCLFLALSPSSPLWNDLSAVQPLSFLVFITSRHHYSNRSYCCPHAKVKTSSCGINVANFCSLQKSSGNTNYYHASLISCALLNTVCGQ